MTSAASVSRTATNPRSSSDASIAAPSACDARHPKLCTKTRFKKTLDYQFRCHTEDACAIGQPLDLLACGRIGRKVRSSQGSMPANGRGSALKVQATDSATEN